MPSPWARRSHRRLTYPAACGFPRTVSAPTKPAPPPTRARPGRMPPVPTSRSSDRVDSRQRWSKQRWQIEVQNRALAAAFRAGNPPPADDLDPAPQGCVVDCLGALAAAADGLMACPWQGSLPAVVDQVAPPPPYLLDTPSGRLHSTPSTKHEHRPSRPPIAEARSPQDLKATARPLAALRPSAR
jgi:hypothetical protein